MPRQARAFDANRELTHARQHRQLAQIADRLNRFVWGARDHPMKGLEQIGRFLERLPFHAVGHERRRGFRDGAPRSLKADIDDTTILDAEVHGQAVAAERVIAFGLPPGLDRAEVPRTLVVIEDYLLIEVLKIGAVGAHTNTSRTLSSA